MLTNYYHNNELAHAYLIHTNNILKCEEVLLKVIKNIFCISKYQDNCHECSICHLIDISNFPSLIVINPDGNFIKKQQILDLKNSFSKSSQYSKNKVYVINNCEKMNKESANTMLKFLEEPFDNIYGFFITNHLESMIPTIQSRCQIINLVFENELFDELSISKEEYEKYLEVAIKYIKLIESDKKLSIINNKLFKDMERNSIKIIFQIIFNIYYNLINNKKSFNMEYKELSFLTKFSTNVVNKKLKIIMEFLQKIDYNVNIDLLLDSFIIEMEGIV